MLTAPVNPEAFPPLTGALELGYPGLIPWRCSRCEIGQPKHDTLQAKCTRMVCNGCFAHESLSAVSCSKRWFSRRGGANSFKGFALRLSTVSVR